MKKLWTKSGMSTTKVYSVWESMKARCYNKNNRYYHNYGGRGITMCDEWLHNPKAFCDWALSNGFNESLQIDRIDNEGNYSPSNCRFVNRSVNSSNQRKKKVNTSGYTGVYYMKDVDRYWAFVRFENKRVSLKTYETAEEAVMARNEYIMRHDLPHPIQGIK